MPAESIKLGESKLDIYETKGISKEGKPFDIVTFSYYDPRIGKAVSLKPEFYNDSVMLEMVYLRGFSGPTPAAQSPAAPPVNPHTK